MSMRAQALRCEEERGVNGSNRSGFTLLEVLIAMVLLGFALLGVQAAITDRMVSDVGRQDSRAIARLLVDDRIQLMQSDPRYAALESEYAGTETLDPPFDGFARTTLVRRREDHTIVTVRVTHPAIGDAISGTIVIGSR